MLYHTSRLEASSSRVCETSSLVYLSTKKENDLNASMLSEFFLLKLVKLITEVMVKPEYSANPSKKSMWEVTMMIREHNEVSIDKAVWDWLTGKPMDQWNRIENSEISQLP